MMPAFCIERSRNVRGIKLPPVAGSFQRQYCFLALAVLLIAFLGCQSSGSKENAATDGPLAPYQLPAPLPISKAETDRIYNACALWYDTSLKPKGFNGGMIVAKNGNIIFEKYNGTGHLPGKDTINENTALQIASTTKTFTAMAILQLWQEGKLNIDDEFSKYFPQFNYPGVTIRTLLNHRSGLPNYTYFMENMGWDKTKTVHNEDVLNFLITHKAEFENIAAPDVHFSYCNTNYALLALLIEKITGKKYAAYLQKVFFDPLNMKHTFVFDMADSSKANLSYDWKGRLMPFGFLDAVYGDKNIYTTVRDLLTWDRFLSSGKVFTPQTLDEAYAPYSNEKPGTKNYGLGWRLNIFPDGKKIIYHNGWWHGSNCSFIRLLKDSVTIIVIGNKFTRAVYHSKILVNLFGDYYTPEEEEESDAMKILDSLAAIKTSPLLQKDSALQKIFKDKNADLPKNRKVKRPVRH